VWFESQEARQVEAARPAPTFAPHEWWQLADIHTFSHCSLRTMVVGPVPGGFGKGDWI